MNEINAFIDSWFSNCGCKKRTKSRTPERVIITFDTGQIWNESQGNFFTNETPLEMKIIDE